MVPVGGAGPMVLSVLWSLACVTLVFVILRLYTRIKVVEAYGIDDHFFNAAFVMLLIYCSLITVAAQYGFGKELEDISNPDDIKRAIIWEAAGQTVVVFAVWVSKSSLAFFLLRLVGTRGQKIAIVVPNIALGLIVTAALIAFWFSCHPVAFLWDRSITGGYCVTTGTTISYIAGVISVFVDFWYAGFPWYMLRGVHMPRREKRLIQISLSLGVLAGACGIERALQLGTLSNQEYLRDTAPLIIWHAAELSVTMVCIGIPVCRPLYKRWLQQLSSSADGKQGYSKSKRSDHGVYTHHTIGGSNFPRAGAPNNDDDIVLRNDIIPSRQRKVFIRGSITDDRVFSDDASDNSILGSEYRGSHQKGAAGPLGEEIGKEVGGIHVKTDFEMETLSR